MKKLAARKAEDQMTSLIKSTEYFKRFYNFFLTNFSRKQKKDTPTNSYLRPILSLYHNQRTTSQGEKNTTMYQYLLRI